MSAEFPVRHAFLRDDLRWEAETRGLEIAPDGSLSLARVPAPPAVTPIRLPGPYAAAPSGIAVDACGRIYASDGERGRLRMRVPDCSFTYECAPGAALAGLAAAGETLYAADRANGRILVYLTPSLELRRVVEQGLAEPAVLAVDAERRLYVLDRGLNRILRFLENGEPDAPYNAAMAAQASIAQPMFLALDTDGALYASEAAGNSIRRFDAQGAALGAIALDSAGALPRALAAREGRLYAADAGSGAILAIDLGSGAQIGEIPDFRAPVAAMALDAKGDLHLKHDAGEACVRLVAGAGCVRSGSLAAGPLDAGIAGDWERVVAEPASAGVEVRALALDAGAPGPAAADWDAVGALLPSTDALLQRVSAPAVPEPGKRRFLWLRVLLRSDDGRSGSRLEQVRAQSAGASLLDKLPRIYRRDDAPRRFLERFLALARSEFEDWDALLEGMSRRFDPACAPAEGLDWLARWLAFEAPRGLSVEGLRALLARLPGLYARRGTLDGVREFAEIYSGIRPRIIEAYTSRRIWQLAAGDADAGASSMLGFDTALAAAAPEGFVVQGRVRTDPAYRGLRGDYYAGYEFETHAASRTDAKIEFAAPAHALEFPAGAGAAGPISARWTGQIRPRYSETYLFRVMPGAGVRVWLDGYPLIDDWNESAAPAPALGILLEADRWYELVLEAHRSAAGADLRLAWSSRSQAEETVPPERLYSVLDDRADQAPDYNGAPEIGGAVVGASGPLAASEFGSMLFSEQAHLFTVLAPAGCCDAERRAALRRAIEAEKPAHTDYHLCFVEPRMRVGFQARLGIDAIVGDGPAPLRLGEASLGTDSVLADAPRGGGRLGERARLGQDTIVG